METLWNYYFFFTDKEIKCLHKYQTRCVAMQKQVLNCNKWPVATLAAVVKDGASRAGLYKCSPIITMDERFYIKRIWTDTIFLVCTILMWNCSSRNFSRIRFSRIRFSRISFSSRSFLRRTFSRSGFSRRTFNRSSFSRKSR